jgi:hypothetical protein
VVSEVVVLVAGLVVALLPLVVVLATASDDADVVASAVVDPLLPIAGGASLLEHATMQQATATPGRAHGFFEVSEKKRTITPQSFASAVSQTGRPRTQNSDAIVIIGRTRSWCAPPLRLAREHAVSTTNVRCRSSA